MRLAREIRAYLGSTSCTPSGRNAWAGWPGPEGVRPFVVVRAVVEGPVDGTTGYVCNITRMDAALREQVLPVLEGVWPGAGVGVREADVVAFPTGASGADRTIGAALEPALRQASVRLAAAFGPPLALCTLDIELSPHTRFTWRAGEPDMVEVTQAFEFSASHRLFVPTLSALDNAALFGKCANANGHGHNYVLEVSVAGRPDARDGRVVNLDDLNAVVRRRVIDAFDHKHLNLDCPEFAALNPTVENIVRVIWNKLAGQMGRTRLARVRLWETPKTWAEYRGEVESLGA